MKEEKKSDHRFEIIAFDLMGVVFYKSHVWRTVLLSILKANGELVEKEHLRKQIKLFNEGKISESKFWRSLDVRDYEKIRKRYIDEILSNLDPSFEHLSLNLKNKITFACLSNHPGPWGEELLNSNDLKGVLV